jgi:hypothetical protein
MSLVIEARSHAKDPLRGEQANFIGNVNFSDRTKVPSGKHITLSVKEIFERSTATEFGMHTTLSAERELRRG